MNRRMLYLTPLVAGLLLSLFEEAPCQLQTTVLPKLTVGHTSQYINSLPTVSPYLSLLEQTGLNNATPTYFTRVRPRLNQREQSLSQQREIRRLQSQVNNVRRDFTQAVQRNAVFQTGHPTRFGNFMHYYPNREQ